MGNVFLVVGATGFLGRAVSWRLLDSGRAVRAMARSPQRASALADRGAEIVQGDLIDRPSLVRACRGATHLFAAAHSLLGRGRYSSSRVDGDGHRALIDAARAAGVSHFVYTSALGASPDHPVDFFRTKFSVEEYLRASGLEWTILRPSAFMEWHVHEFNGKSIVESGKTTILGRGSKLRNFIAVQDVAAFAMLALTDPDLRNRTLDIGGPDNMTNTDVAALYGRILGVAPRITRVPPGALRLLGAALRSFAPGIARLMYMSSLPDDAYTEAYDAKALAGFPVRLTTIESFVRGQAAATAIEDDAHERR